MRPNYTFWRKAVSNVPSFALDPMTNVLFKLQPTDKIATAGSCFAQNISRGLRAHGLHYYVAESAPARMSDAEARSRSFGTFSARYGNIYTVRQLVQLFDRAYGRFSPALGTWRTRDRAVIDPFRPVIEPNGFACIDDLLQDRAGHFASVRRMFEGLSVFIFTLGLTEGWQHRDGTVVPLAPGVVAEAEDSADFGFVNFTTKDVAADLDAFHSRLRQVNPGARIILTVSPVPLIATYEDRHVLVSTTYSKSALHVAAIDAARKLPDVSYFPSYEIITSPLNRDRYFEEDLRSVSAMGVDHVMRVFFRHYVSADADHEAFLATFRNDARASAAVVCDEETIEL